MDLFTPAMEKIGVLNGNRLNKLVTSEGLESLQKAERNTYLQSSV